MTDRLSEFCRLLLESSSPRSVPRMRTRKPGDAATVVEVPEASAELETPDSGSNVIAFPTERATGREYGIKVSE